MVDFFQNNSYDGKPDNYCQLAGLKFDGLIFLLHIRLYAEIFSNCYIAGMHVTMKAGVTVVQW